MIGFVVWIALAALACWLSYHLGFWVANQKHWHKQQRAGRLREHEELGMTVHEALTEPLTGPRPPFTLFGDER